MTNFGFVVFGPISKTMTRPEADKMQKNLNYWGSLGYVVKLALFDGNWLILERHSAEKDLPDVLDALLKKYHVDAAAKSKKGGHD